ncbi:hypothetical protein [Nonomuraea soli]|uniref:Adenine/guanine phosphoribosyltransferase-like PRPP-binding protein n=1 Tax=Nonomuraea soli TaxID=1032476 RepID=A0A7W0CHY3_9ACTN|nr:hypothetical protein [Nonomuraea soli]MBA2891260.1 adenine/guanine phosphoribosyltransferase-like PRPP-binding protein [Nonomuraea soli]
MSFPVETPLDVQSIEVRRAELRQDVVNAVVRQSGRLELSAMLTRPSILRRMASLLAAHVPPGTDRLVCSPGSLPLAAALALETGVPFAVLGDVPMGDLFPGEKAVLVVAVVSTGASAAALAGAAGAETVLAGLALQQTPKIIAAVELS